MVIIIIAIIVDHHHHHHDFWLQERQALPHVLLFPHINVRIGAQSQFRSSFQKTI